MTAGMRRHIDPRTKRTAFAAGLLLRPTLIVPMASSGPLASSDLLPIGLASLLVASLTLAACVFLGNRVAIALGIFSGLAGLPVATVGAFVGLALPWPLFLAAYNLALAVIGIVVWEAPPPRRAA